MANEKYDWAEGAKLDDHSRRKLKVLREYFYQYLIVRCQIRRMPRFRLAVVDGFAGAGRYACGTPGSPLVFIEELRRASDAINIDRASKGLKALAFDCLFVFNDANRETIEILKKNVAPLHAAIKEECENIEIEIFFESNPFEVAYPAIRRRLVDGKHRNVIFNLDQYGYSFVSIATIRDIMMYGESVEIFLTFLIEPLITFLEKSNPQSLEVRLRPLGVSGSDLGNLQRVQNRREWLGVAERLVFDVFKSCAGFVSTFSIHNPDGWRYWLIHFANARRARQVYNDGLHQNASMQAHYGRSGLDMLCFDPSHDRPQLYLFDEVGRAMAVEQLKDDIPRFLSKSREGMSMDGFYRSVYNETPAHFEDINKSIIEHPEIEVVTPKGGARRVPKAIRGDDIIRLGSQRSFFTVLLDQSSKKR